MTCFDAAKVVVDVFMTALASQYSSKGPCPPSTPVDTVHFFAGGHDVVPMPNEGCSDPLLWVRVTQRYLSKYDSSFPDAFVSSKDCRTVTIRVIDIELGVSRLTCLESNYIDFDILNAEARESLDDSWRIQNALTCGADTLSQNNKKVAIDTIVPLGPVGGVVSWAGLAHAQI